MNRWIRLALTGGAEALVPRHSPGRPPKLSEEQIRELADDLRKDPGEFVDSEGTRFTVWDRCSIQEHIRVKFQVDIPVRRCVTLVHSLGLPLCQRGSSAGRKS